MDYSFFVFRKKGTLRSPLSAHGVLDQVLPGSSLALSS